MSKLGNVYELDFNTRMKNKYPVVYMNDKFIVCKRNGTNSPITFTRNDGSIYIYGEVLDYAIFKAMDNPLEYRSGYNIYVPHGTNESFSEFFVGSENQKQLEKAKKILWAAENNFSSLKKQLSVVQERYICAQAKVDECQKVVDKYEKLVAKEVLEKNEQSV